MDCREARTHFLDYQRGRLDSGLSGDVRAHLDACPACSHGEAAERALTDLLERRLPQHPASPALKRRLAAQWAAPPAPGRAWRDRWERDVLKVRKL